MTIKDHSNQANDDSDSDGSNNCDNARKPLPSTTFQRMSLSIAEAPCNVDVQTQMMRRLSHFNSEALLQPGQWRRAQGVMPAALSSSRNPQSTPIMVVGSLGSSFAMLTNLLRCRAS